jgi:hypothetical protein
VKKRRLAILAVLAVVVAAAIAFVARSAHASAQATDTYNFIVVPQGRTSFVDNPPKAAKGKFDPRPGDGFASRGRIFDAAGSLEVGRISEYCTETVKDPVTFECSISVIINDGEMVAAGAINPLALPYTLPVVGGTGTYFGAQGVLQVTTQSQTQEKWTLSVRR